METVLLIVTRKQFY